MTWKTFNSVIVPLFILLPIILGAIKFKILPSSIKLVWYYLIVSAIINTSATIIGRVFHTNNLPLIHLYTILEGLLLISFYAQILSTSSNVKKFRFLQILFVLICISNALFFQSIYIYCSYTRPIVIIIIMILSINYFAKIFAESLDSQLPFIPIFYFNVGIFLYYSGAFMLSVFSNFTLADSNSETDYYIIWGFHAILNLIMYLIFSIGFILCKK